MNFVIIQRHPVPCAWKYPDRATRLFPPPRPARHDFACGIVTMTNQSTFCFVPTGRYKAVETVWRRSVPRQGGVCACFEGHTGAFVSRGENGKLLQKDAQLGRRLFFLSTSKNISRNPEPWTFSHICGGALSLYNRMYNEGVHDRPPNYRFEGRFGRCQVSSCQSYLVMLKNPRRPSTTFIVYRCEGCKCTYRPFWICRTFFSRLMKGLKTYCRHLNDFTYSNFILCVKIVVFVY